MSFKEFTAAYRKATLFRQSSDFLAPWDTNLRDNDELLQLRDQGAYMPERIGRALGIKTGLVVRDS